jgi:hypothetical protein
MRIDDQLLRWWVALDQRCRDANGRRDGRGDVPGWVMITVMTAGIVGVLWLVAEEQLKNLLSNALDSVGSN